MGLSAWLGLETKDILALAISNLIGFAVAMLLPDPAWRVYVSILVSYHLFLAWLVFGGDHKAGLSMPLAATIFTHGACVFLIVCLGLMRAHVPFFSILRYAIVAIALFEHKWMFSLSRQAPKDEGPIDLMRPRSAPGLGQSPALAMAGGVAPAPAEAMPIATAAAAPASVLEPQIAAIPKYEPIFVTPQAQAAAAAAPPRGDDKKRKPAAPIAQRVDPLLTATAQDHEDWLRYCSTRNPTDRRPGITVREEYEQWLMARFRMRAAKEAKVARVAAR